MRTDVKVGVICAFAIVLCVVIFVVAKGSGKNTPKPTQPTSLSSTGGSHADPVIPDRPTGNSGTPVTGEVIGMPGASSNTPAASSGTGSSTPLAGAGGTVATPGMTGSNTPVSPTPSTGTPSVGASTPLAGTGSFSTGGTPPLIPTVGTTGSGSAAPGASITLGTAVGTGTNTNTGAGTTYKIQQGDMLIAVAKKFGVTVKSIEAANPGLDANRLKINTVIKIPAPTATTATPRPATATTGTPLATGATVTPRPGTTGGTGATPARTNTTAIRPGSTYVIKRGDSLASISRAAYGNTTGTAKIFRANRDQLDDPDTMPVGVSIKIP